MNGQDVLCLASGGGQQSVAFGLLGANVTVFDLTPAQLERDREAAAHYDLPITTVQGDMRDLSHFEGAVFDIVWHAYSINFVPEVESVFDEAVRVLKSAVSIAFSFSTRSPRASMMRVGPEGLTR